MSYNKTVWEDLPSTNTPLNATNLNNIENGIETLDQYASSIVQSGSNTNGRYVKLIDGTLICYGSSATQNCNASTSTNFTITLPSSFVNNLYIVTFSKRNGGNNFVSVEERTDSINTSSFTIYVWNNSSGIAYDIQYDYIAIGRWK